MCVCVTCFRPTSFPVSSSVCAEWRWSACRLSVMKAAMRRRRRMQRREVRGQVWLVWRSCWTRWPTALYRPTWRTLSWWGAPMGEGCGDGVFWMWWQPGWWCFVDEVGWWWQPGSGCFVDEVGWWWQPGWWCFVDEVGWWWQPGSGCFVDEVGWWWQPGSGCFVDEVGWWWQPGSGCFVD